MVEFLFHDDFGAGGLARLGEGAAVQWTAVHSMGHWYIVLHDDPERCGSEARRTLINAIANALRFPADLRSRIEPEHARRRAPLFGRTRGGPRFQVA